MAPRRTFPLRLLATFLIGTLLTACSQSTTAAPAQTASATPFQVLSGVPMSKAYALTAVQTELRDFLELWRTDGYATASAAYLVASEQLPPSAPAGILASGRITYLTEDEWTSADLFVVFVNVDLTFRGDSGGNWASGTNSRFVTARARAGTIPYVLEFATSR
jgi:hypothetical protein